MYKYLSLIFNNVIYIFTVFMSCYHIYAIYYLFSWLQKLFSNYVLSYAICSVHSVTKSIIFETELCTLTLFYVICIE